jgi:hypothetical protein
MPINKALYPPDWKQISRRIRFERAGGCCEWCGVANGEHHPKTGSIVVLTTHHVGIDKPDGTPGDRHDKMDCRDENLAALCQSCHWTADWDIHFKRKRAADYERKYQLTAALAAGQRSLFHDE